jgi:hypothetical protein
MFSSSILLMKLDRRKSISPTESTKKKANPMWAGL